MGALRASPHWVLRDADGRLNSTCDVALQMQNFGMKIRRRPDTSPLPPETVAQPRTMMHRPSSPCATTPANDKTRFQLPEDGMRRRDGLVLNGGAGEAAGSVPGDVGSRVRSAHGQSSWRARPPVTFAARISVAPKQTWEGVEDLCQPRAVKFCSSTMPVPVPGPRSPADAEDGEGFPMQRAEGCQSEPNGGHRPAHTGSYSYAGDPLSHEPMTRHEPMTHTGSYAGDPWCGMAPTTVPEERKGRESGGGGLVWGDGGGGSITVNAALAHLLH
jgi:hypothetical protein